jgi:hypothetical protein
LASGSNFLANSWLDVDLFQLILSEMETLFQSAPPNKSTMIVAPVVMLPDDEQEIARVFVVAQEVVNDTIDATPIVPSAKAVAIVFNVLNFFIFVVPF